jgi:hypothetical protein
MSRLFFRKWVLKPFLILLLWMVGLIGTGIILLMVNQERIVRLGINEFNKQIQGDLVVDTSKISIFKHFPSVGVSLRQGKLYANKSHAGPAIFTFERFYVGISIPDLLDGNYNLRRFSVTGGRLDVVRDVDGNLNLLRLFEISSDTARQEKQEKTSFDINLQKISFKKTQINFTDYTNGRNYSTTIDQLTSSFSSDTSRMVATITSIMDVDINTSSDTAFLRHKKVEIDLAADYKIGQQLLTISSGNLKVQDASFAVTGTANLRGTPDLDLHIKGDKPDFNLFTAFMPNDVRSSLERFTYDGQVHFDGLIKGKIAQDTLPYMEISFGCEDGWFHNDKENARLDSVGFKGYYTNGAEHSLRTSELHITNMNARPGKGTFRGNFVLRDFTDPQILMQLHSDLELKFLGDFLGISDLQQFTGGIELEMDFKEIVDIKVPEQSLSKLKEGVQSRLLVKDLSFNIPGYPHRVKNVNLHARMENSRVTLDSAVVRIGGSDLKLSGTISDLVAFVRDRKRPVTVTLAAQSKQILMKELFSYDTALANMLDEDIRNLNVAMSLQTSVEQLLSPSPLPEGTFEVKNLRASFRKYPHLLKGVDATVQILDTMLLVKNLDGIVDSSDFRLSGHVKNYAIWFDSLMKGRTQIAFDFKSNRFALDDFTVKGHRKFIPRAYRHERLDSAWLSAKVDLRYDTGFRFARAEITNVTGLLRQHKLRLKDIQGRVKYGNRVMALDTLKGKIGKSDFDITMRLYNGENKSMKKRTNYVRIKSDLLDFNEITAYDFSTPPSRRQKKLDSIAIATGVAVKKDSSAHAKAFNIFTLPFSDFNLQADIGRLRYNKIGIRDLKARVRITEDHFLYIDTVGLRIAGGTVAAKGEMNGTDTTRLFLKSRIVVNELDLEKVLLKLDHFGQDVMINKNVKGRLSGEIISTVQVHPDLVPMVGNSSAHLDIEIYDGTLVDFAPMQAMGSYFKDKNLRLIRFDSLKNELSFANGVFEIPEMNINSSIGYIEMSGKQSLDLNMEYYLRIPMKMVTEVGFNSLFDKKQQEVDLNQLDEIEYSGKDKKTRFVHVKVVGTPDDFKVSLGKNKRKT